MRQFVYRTFIGGCLAWLAGTALAQTPTNNSPAAPTPAQLHQPDSTRLQELLTEASSLYKQDPSKAQLLAQQAGQLAQQLHKPALVTQALLLRGRIANVLGEPQQATEQLMLALRQATAQRDTMLMAQAHLYLGTTYKGLHHYAPALQSAVQARQLFGRAAQGGQPKALRGVAVAYNNSGTVHLDQQQYPAAAADFNQALHRGRALGDSGVVVLALYNLGAIALKTKQPAAAHRYYRQTLAIDQADENVQGQAESWLNLGDALAMLKRPKEAEAAYGHALQLARQIQAGPILRVVYDGFATLYEDTGQLPQALRWRKQFQQLNDSLFQAESAEQVTEMRTKYETEQKDAQNRLQAAQLRTQSQVIRRRNTQLVAALLVTGLLGVVGYLLYNRRRLRQQVEMEQQRQLLERQRAAAVLEAEENERRRIGSDLHDGIGQLLTAAKLNLHALGQQLGARLDGQQVLLDNAVEVVDESFREVRSISHNLMPNALLKRGLSAAVRDFLDKLPSGNGLRVEVEAFGLDDVRLDPTVESVLFRVIQELVQNIVKHARATQISLQLIRNEQELTVMVEDNGVGFDPAALGPDAGIGLRNIETRMAYLGGRAEFDAAPGRGTTVTLEVPLTAPAVA